MESRSPDAAPIAEVDLSGIPLDEYFMDNCKIDPTSLFFAIFQHLSCIQLNPLTLDPKTGRTCL